MTITAWRFCKLKHLKTALTGEGARRGGGRWNSKGIPVVYASESISLAALESLVGMAEETDILEDYVYVSLRFDEKICLTVDNDSLPDDWTVYPQPQATKAIGDEWYKKKASVVLRVPSVIVPEESNFILNPDHPDFNKVEIGDPQPFHFDPRLKKRPK